MSGREVKENEKTKNIRYEYSELAVVILWCVFVSPITAHNVIVITICGNPLKICEID